MDLSETLFKEITGILEDAPIYGASDDRRQVPRVSFGSRARIFPLFEGAGGWGCPVLVRDISRSGIGFLFGDELSVSDEFIIQLPTQTGGFEIIQCMVQRCERGGMGLVQFVIGATFELVLDAQQWLKSRPELPANAGGSMGPMLATVPEPVAVTAAEPAGGALSSLMFWKRMKADRSSSKIRSRLLAHRSNATATATAAAPIAPAAPTPAAAPLPPMPGAAINTTELPPEVLERAHSNLFLPPGVPALEIPPLPTTEAAVTTPVVNAPAVAEEAHAAQVVEDVRVDAIRAAAEQPTIAVDESPLPASALLPIELAAELSAIAEISRPAVLAEPTSVIAITTAAASEIRSTELPVTLPAVSPEPSAPVASALPASVPSACAAEGVFTANGVTLPSSLPIATVMALIAEALQSAGKLGTTAVRPVSPNKEMFRYPTANRLIRGRSRRA